MSHDVRYQTWEDLCRAVEGGYPGFPINGIDGDDPDYLLKVWQNLEPLIRTHVHTKMQTIDIMSDQVIAQNISLLEQAPSEGDYDAIIAHINAQRLLRTRQNNLVAALHELSDELLGASQSVIIGEELTANVSSWLWDWAHRQEESLNQTQSYIDDLEAQARTLTRNVIRRRKGFPDASWTRGKWLGSGTYGEAAVWLRQDSNGIVTDRVAVKTCKAYAPDSSPHLWNDDRTVPTEVTAMSRLAECSNTESLVKLRNWAMLQDKSQYNLYLEFCAHGDLADIAAGYFEKNAEGEPQINRRNGFVPEPFAWSVFEGLVKNGLLLLQGDVQNPVDGWATMVHRDVKLPNIFLATNTTGFYPGYPIAKLGDFGISVTPKPPGTQSMYSFEGKHGGMPPELLNSHLINPNTNVISPNDRTPVTSKSDVWSVGHAMWCLLLGGPRDSEWMSAVNDDGTFQYVPTMPQLIDEERYSKELRKLIYACLDYYPDKRPTFKQLLDHIEGLHELSDSDPVGGLRSYRDGYAPAGSLPLKFPGDDVPLGMKLSDAAGLEEDRSLPPRPRLPGAAPTPEERLFDAFGRTYVEAIPIGAAKKAAAAVQAAAAPAAGQNTAVAGANQHIPAVDQNTGVTGFAAPAGFVAGVALGFSQRTAVPGASPSGGARRRGRGRGGRFGR